MFSDIEFYKTHYQKLQHVSSRLVTILTIGQKLNTKGGSEERKLIFERCTHGNVPITFDDSLLIEIGNKFLGSKAPGTVSL